ncbi:MAG: isomerase [Gammaproteobacteria bacterium]|jgi:styrene-oxide isomerase
MERLQQIMLGHGLLVILAAMLAGFMLMFNLLGGVEIWPGTIIEIPMYGTSAGWVRAHTGGALNGVLVIIVALALPKLKLGEFAQKFTAYGLIYCAWTFTLFYWLGNASSNRGLSIGASALGEPDLIGLIAFLPGVPSVFIVPIVLVLCAKSVLSR